MSTPYARANKPREIEGLLDVALIRPLGYALTLVLRRTPITPNMVSVASVLAAAGAAIAWYGRTPGGALAGLGFMLLTSALDSADGQLARITGQKSDFGRFLDGLCDNASFFVMYLSIVLSHHVHQGGSLGWLIALGAIAGASHSAQSAAAEYARMAWLHYTRGTGEIADEQPERLLERVGRAATPLERAFLRMHLNYAAQQRWLQPSAAVLERAHALAIARRPETGAWFATRYAEANRSLVGAWFLGASNVHKVGLVVTAGLPHLLPWPFLRHWDQVLYLGWDLLLNVPFAILLWRQGQRNRELAAELAERAGA